MSLAIVNGKVCIVPSDNSGWKSSTFAEMGKYAIQSAAVIGGGVAITAVAATGASAAGTAVAVTGASVVTAYAVSQSTGDNNTIVPRESLDDFKKEVYTYTLDDLPAGGAGTRSDTGAEHTKIKPESTTSTIPPEYAKALQHFQQDLSGYHNTMSSLNISFDSEVDAPTGCAAPSMARLRMRDDSTPAH